MKRIIKKVAEISGVEAQLSPRQISFGGFVNLQNMVQIEAGKLRKIPGVFHASVLFGLTREPSIDASTIRTFAQVQVPQSTQLKEIALFETSADIKVVDMRATPPVALTNSGTAWVQNSPGSTSVVRYANQTLIAAQKNTIHKMLNAATYNDMVGTNIPQGFLLQPFYDRLFVAGTVDANDVEEPFVYYSDVLSNNFGLTNILNTSELPGGVKALAINAVTTDTAGIATDLLVFKASSIFVYNEVRKDVLTETIGTFHFKTISNTVAGVVFLGAYKGINSVYWIPYGQPVAPVEIGQALLRILNPDGKLLLYSFSLFDGQFYRLHFGFSTGVGIDAADRELWLDATELAKTQKPVWYGVHKRGDFSAGFIEPVDGHVHFLRPGTANSSRYFIEANEFDSRQAVGNGGAPFDYKDVNGEPLVSEIDMPLNVEPVDDKKTFGLLELQITKDANLSGNDVTVQVIAENKELDTRTVSIYDASAKNANFVHIGLAAQERISTTARDMRVKIIHHLNQLFELEGMAVQYERHEDDRMRSKVR